MNKQSVALLRVRWQILYTRCRTFWQGLAAREQRAVALTALVLGGFVVWLALIEPPLKTIAYWQAETPKLRSQTEALEVLLRDVSVLPQANLSKWPCVRPSTPVAWESITNCKRLAPTVQAPGN